MKFSVFDFRFIFCFMLIGDVYAANEINSFSPGITTAYSVIRQTNGNVWYVTGQVFEVWGTGARTAADYDIALTDKSGGMFVGNFDNNISAGYYHIATHYQAGGAPADTDPIVWTEYGYWDGDEWLTGIIQDINDVTPTASENADAVWDEAMAGHTGETTFGGELQTLDPNITQILADTDELQTDWTNGGRLDSILDDINDVTSILEIVDTTVSAAGDANSFTLTAGQDANEAYTGNTIYVQDADDGEWESRIIISWTSARVVVVDYDFTFTPAVADRAVVWKSYFPMKVYEGLPKREPPAVIDVDYRVSTGGGTRTLDVFGDDP